VSALPVSRILALEIAWFASPQLGGIEILEAGCLGSARSGGVCARLDALEHTLGLFSSPEPEAAPPTPANGGLWTQLPHWESPVVPLTDDKDTSPMPSARSGSSPSLSAPGGDSSMLCGSLAKPFSATTAASEVPPIIYAA